MQLRHVDVSKVERGQVDQRREASQAVVADWARVEAEARELRHLADLVQPHVVHVRLGEVKVRELRQSHQRVDRRRAHGTRAERESPQPLQFGDAGECGVGECAAAQDE